MSFNTRDIYLFVFEIKNQKNMNEDSESNSHHHNKRLSSKSEKRVWYIKHGLINLFFIGCWLVLSTLLLCTYI